MAGFVTNDEVYDDNRINVQIVELTVVPKVQRKMKRRSRGIKTDGETINRLSGLIDKPLITTPALVGLTPGIFKINRYVEGNVDIPGGYSATTGTFNMTVKEESDHIVKTIYVVGYTDGYDVSFKSRLFDPSVTLFINKVYITSQTKTRKGLTKPKAIDVLSVVDGSFERAEDDLHLLRAEDVLLSFASEELYGSNMDIDNTTNNTARNPVGRGVDEMSGSRIVQRVINSINQFSKKQEGFQKDDLDTMTNAHNSTLSTSLASIEFISMLSSRSNYNLVTSFSIDDLFRTFGDFDVEAEKVIHSAINTGYAHDAADINESDDDALAANEILFSIATIAAENLITHITFEANNFDGRPQGNVLDADCIIPGIDAIIMGETVLRTFLLEIWPTITENNGRDLSIFVEYTHGVKGGRVDIGYDGDNMVPFHLPTDMDGLLSPDLHTEDALNNEIRSFNRVKKLIL